MNRSKPTIATLLAAMSLMAGAAASPDPASRKERTEKKRAAAEAAEKAEADRLSALEEKVADLERRLRALEARRQAKAPAPSATPEQEQQARRLYQEADRAIQSGEYDTARERLRELNQTYRGTAAQRQAQRLSQTLAVLGKPAPATLDIERWFQGQEQVKWPSDGTTLIVFWEQWCPHCRREVPKIEKTWERYRERGLQVIGVTKITRGATEEKVQQFITDSHLTYPIAKENGELSRAFNVSSIPAAAVVKDGKIVWRGHPARLTEAMLEKWL